MNKFVYEYKSKYDKCHLKSNARVVNEETAILMDIDLRNLNKPKKRFIVFLANESKTKKKIIVSVELCKKEMKAGGVIRASVRQFIKEGCRLKEAQLKTMSLIEKHNNNSESFKRYL